MKMSPKLRRNLIVGGALFAVATPSFAILGVGDIVFDPTSYASLVSQLTTLKLQYTMLQNNLIHFSMKQAWQTTLTQMKQANVANMFGETNGMGVALNTNNPSASTTAWTSASVPVNANATAYLAAQNPNTAQRSQLAMVEASDSVSPDCLTAIGAYRQARTNSLAAQQNLQNAQLDTSSTTNSEVEQLNLLNAAHTQQMTEVQAQGTLQTCLASQAAVANMQQRNAAANDLNTWGFVAQERQVNDANPVNGSETWTTYLP